MPFSILDLVVLGVVLISALLASVRGFAREVLAILAWLGAAAAAWALHPLALPLAKQYISNPSIALVAAIGGIFIVTLIVVSLITVQISDMVLDSRIGALDRTLGFAFGAARGYLLCAITWIFFAALIQGKEPAWATDARMRPMLQNTGESFVTMLPQNADSLILKFLKPKPPEGDPVEPPSEAAEPQHGPVPPPAPRRG